MLFLSSGFLRILVSSKNPAEKSDFEYGNIRSILRIFKDQWYNRRRLSEIL